MNLCSDWRQVDHQFSPFRLPQIDATDESPRFYCPKSEIKRSIDCATHAVQSIRFESRQINSDFNKGVRWSIKTSRKCSYSKCLVKFIECVAGAWSAQSSESSFIAACFASNTHAHAQAHVAWRENLFSYMMQRTAYTHDAGCCVSYHFLHAHTHRNRRNKPRPASLRRSERQQQKKKEKRELAPSRRIWLICHRYVAIQTIWRVELNVTRHFGWSQVKTIESSTLHTQKIKVKEWNIKFDSLRHWISTTTYTETILENFECGIDSTTVKITQVNKKWIIFSFECVCVCGNVHQICTIAVCNYALEDRVVNVYNLSSSKQTSMKLKVNEMHKPSRWNSVATKRCENLPKAEWRERKSNLHFCRV